MNKLEQLRKEINKIDEELITLFEKRMDIVKDIYVYKKENDLNILDSSRESDLININTSKLSNKEYISYYKEVLDILMKVSKDLQANMR